MFVGGKKHCTQYIVHMKTAPYIHGLMYTVVHGNTWCGTWQYMVWCIPPSCFVALSASLHQVFSSCKKRIGFIFSPSPMASQSWIWYSSSKLSFQRWPILKHLAQNINFSKPFLSIWELIWVTQSGESQNYPESDTWKNFKMQFRKGGKICTTVVICQRQPAFTSKTCKMSRPMLFNMV